MECNSAEQLIGINKWVIGTLTFLAVTVAKGVQVLAKRRRRPWGAAGVGCTQVERGRPVRGRGHPAAPLLLLLG